jgi:SAM-dependent methyltransferase
VTLDELERVFRFYISRVPVSLALRETMRMVALAQKLPQQASVLDVGCGDGSFWRAFPQADQYQVDGVDLSSDEAALARKEGVFRELLIADISQTTPDRKYDVVLGNCSLEHVPNIHAALTNIRQALHQDGRLLLFVPAFGWARSMPGLRTLGRFSTRLGMAASGALDGFFQHHHIYDARSWRLLVTDAGFRVTQVSALASPLINDLFARHLPLALLEFLYKTVMRSYPPRLGLFRRMVGRPALLEILRQPLPIDSPGVVEYVLEAVPS